MAQPSTGTCPSTSTAPTAAGRPSGLMVMALRAAEQHVLVVVGEADLHTAGQLRDHLIDALGAQPPSVRVELAGLEFCDLAGLDALHDAARAAHAAGIALTFRGMSPQLSWLHRTFPPRSPVPPSSTPGLDQPVPGTPAAATRSPTPRTPGSPPTPGTAESTPPAPAGGTSAVQGPAHPDDRTGAHPSAGPSLRAEATSEYLMARGGGRRGAPDGLVHAVPTSDTTRSAVCGAQTRPATSSWTGAAPSSCPDCAAAVATSAAVGTVYPFAAPWAGAGIRRQHQPRAMQVS